MKKLLVLLMALLLLVGCSGGKPSTSTPTTETKNEVTVVSTLDVISMDTAVATDGTSFIAQTMCMAGLMELDENQNPILDLAASYEVSEDGLNYTFKIRDDANWSNGDPVTAADFVYAWDRMVDPDIASEYDWILDTCSIVGYEAVDEKTLNVTLSNPCGFFLGLLAFPTFFPVNQAYCEEKGDQYALSADAVICCGPYLFTSWTSGYSYEFELNPDYYGYNDYVAAGTAEKVIFRVIADTQTALLEYQSGNLDTVILSGEQVTANNSEPGFTNRLAGYLFYLLININNNEDDTDMQNLNARKAMSYAINRAELATSLNDGSIAAEGIVPYTLAGNPETGADFRDDNGAQVSYDLETAKAAYEAAKAELGHDIEIELLYGTDEGDSIIKAAEQVQYYLEEVGFIVNLNGKPKKERLSLQREHSFEVALTRWGPDYADPQTYMDLFVSSNTSNNQGGIKSDVYDALIDHAESGIAAADRWADFLAAETVLVADEYDVVPVFQSGGAMLINPAIGGIQFHCAAVDNYRHIVIK